MEFTVFYVVVKNGPADPNKIQPIFSQVTQQESRNGQHITFHVLFTFDATSIQNNFKLVLGDPKKLAGYRSSGFRWKRILEYDPQQNH